MYLNHRLKHFFHKTIKPTIKTINTHYSLQKYVTADRFNGKIFCIGANKTGTTSLEAALNSMGYDLGNQARAEMLAEECYEGRFERLIRFCDLHQAFQDVPFSLSDTYKVLDQAFPNSKFILTVRSSPEAWFHSMCKFQSKIFGKDGKLPTEEDLKNSNYGYRGLSYDYMKRNFNYPNTPLYEKETYIRIHEKRNQEIKDYFKDRDNQLLILNVSEEYALQKLGAYLGFKFPRDLQFPWINKT